MTNGGSYALVLISQVDEEGTEHVSLSLYPYNAAVNAMGDVAVVTKIVASYPKESYGTSFERYDEYDLNRYNHYDVPGYYPEVRLTENGELVVFDRGTFVRSGILLGENNTLLLETREDSRERVAYKTLVNLLQN